MTSYFVSTLVFILAAFVVKRRLADLGLPPGLTRKLCIFLPAALAAYSVAWLVDKILV